MLWVNSCITGPAPSLVLSLRHILSSFRARSLFFLIIFMLSGLFLDMTAFLSETTYAWVWRICMCLSKTCRRGVNNNHNNDDNIRRDAVCLWTVMCADTSMHLIRFVFAQHVNEERNYLHFPCCILSCSRTILQQIGNTLECKWRVYFKPTC